VGAQIVVALQALVSRRTDPLDSAVISITKFHAGSAGNVIPEEAELYGTVRTLRPETQDMMERLITHVAQGTAAAHDAEAAVRYIRGYPPTVNHPEQTERAAHAAARVLGERGVIRNRPPAMGGEDFSFMLLERPGAFIFVGNGDTAGLHNAKYDFNDAALPAGMSFWARLVEMAMPAN
jgi:amidohydrolase